MKGSASKSLTATITKDVMLITKNFRILVILSRLFGGHPHPMFSDKSLKTGKLAKLWCGIWMVTNLTMSGLAVREFVLCETPPCTRIINKILLTLGYALTALMAAVRDEKFERAMLRIQEFDAATGSTKQPSVPRNFVAAVFVIFSWSCAAWIWLDRDLRNMPITSIFRFIGFCAVTLEVNKYCFFFYALLERFVQLKRIVVAGKIDVVSTSHDVFRQTLTVQNVFELHHKLAEAVENLNQYFDAQLVFWLGYFICDLLVVSYVLTKNFPGYGFQSGMAIRFFLSFYYPALICSVSHFACKKANELGKLLFGYNAPVLATTVSHFERLEFGFWLFQRPLKISALRLFYVDLPLLLSMIEASATYTTFIIQSVMETNKTKSTN